MNDFRLDNSGEDCRRVRVKIDGQNYYVVLGQRSISITVPRENSMEMERERRLFETICALVTEALGGT